LLVSEKNFIELADKLATMRGAAMKAGQLLSMDAGSLVPKELAILLDRLRSEAVVMPSLQLIDVLEKNWGDHWQDTFQQFSFNPIAAASIGQVHRAITKDQRELAIKIQYPGVKESIDSDLDNVFGLLRLSGLIPKEVNLDPLVDEARLQLKREADYQYEAEQLAVYTDNLNSFARRDELALPVVHTDLSTDQILCMSFMKGGSLEALANAPQAERNRVMSLMMVLFFEEFLAHHCVQTDPNLANFLYEEESKKLVLLDFGATRSFDSDFVAAYKSALYAAAQQDREALLSALYILGFFDSSSGKVSSNQDIVLDIFILAAEPLRFDGAYDFGRSNIAEVIRDKGMAMRGHRDAWHSPPPDVLFLHRKMGGIYLMAKRFGAQIDVKKLFGLYC
ncbi:MAG: ABC1 kinase family protein, partial [Pontibacterium sp.]